MSRTKIFQYKIKADDQNIRLIDFLIKKFTYLSEQEWRIEISNKNLSIVNRNTVEDYILMQSDVIQFSRNSYSEPEIDKDYKIVYESENLLIINKPGNLPVHPAGRYKENTLLSLLLKDFGFTELFPAHRLDRETSGIQIFAKNKKTASVIQKHFEERVIKKKYIVYVHGNFPDFLNAKGYLRKDENSLIRKKKKFSEIFTENSTPCDTIFQLISKENQISKVLAIPITGKNHQIRATLFSLGYPVYGDKIYGKDEGIFLNFIKGNKSLEFQRQALHSYSVILPETNFYPKLEIVVPEPKDLEEVFSTRVEKLDPSPPRYV